MDLYLLTVSAVMRSSVFRFTRLGTVAFVVPIAITVAVPLTAAAAASCTTSWTGAFDQSFTTAGNWDHGVPGPSDLACIATSGTSTITVGADVSLDALTVDSTAGVQTVQVLPGASVTVEGPDQSTFGTNAVVQVGDATGGASGAAKLVDAGPLESDGALTVTGNGLWRQPQYATATFAGQVTNGGQIDIVGHTVETAGTLMNQGSFATEPGGYLAAKGTSVFDNASGGTVTVGGGLSGATWQQSGGTITSGIVDIIDGGTLNLSGGGGGAFRIGHSATVIGDIASNQSLTIGSVATGTVVRFPSSVTNAGALTVDGQGGLPVNLSVNGTLTNTGSLTVDGDPRSTTGLSSGQLLNAGTMIVGPQGESFSTGSGFTQDSSGTLVLGIGNSGASSVTTSGTAQLAGTLELGHVASDAPPAGAVPVITAGAVSGQFATVTLTDQQTPFKLTYTATQVTASRASHTNIAVTTPQSLTIGSTGALGVTLHNVETSGTVPGATVAVYARPAGGQQHFLSSAVMDATGQATFTVKPTVNTTYTFAYAGDQSHFASTATATLPVRPRISMKASALHLRTGTKETFTGAITPAHGNATIYLQKMQRDATYKTIKTIHTDSKGKYVVNITALRGDNTYRTVTAATSNNAAGIAHAVTIRGL